MKARKSRSTPSPATMPARGSEPYRTVVEDLTETICRFLPDGTFTYVNDVFCRFFGKRSDELVGTRWQPVVVTDDLPGIEAKLRTLSPKNPTVVIENRIVDGTGQVRWMQFINRAFFDDKGHLVETQSVGRDTTERVLAERQLSEAKERWRFALESSGFGVWDWDLERDTVFYSDEWKRMLGYSPGDAVDGGVRGWQSLPHPDDLPHTLAAVGDHLAGRSGTYTGEFRARCKDGSWKWVRARGQVIRRDKNGQAQRMIGTTTDISLHKAAEEREAHNLQMIAQGAPCAAVLEAIVYSMEASYPGMRCMVMLADVTGSHLRMSAAPSLPEYVKKELDFLPIEAGVGCCGAAAYTGQRVICADVYAEKRMEPFHRLALKAKLRACWSEPIMSGAGQVLGTFACFHRVPHAPDSVEIQAITTTARLAAMAIEHEQQDKALRISEERYARALRGTTDGLWDWNILTGEVYLSPRWKEMLGFHEDELPSHRDNAFISRLHPEDEPKVRAMRQAHFKQRVPYQVEFRLLNKAGNYLWFVARGQAEWDEHGEAVRMSGTISDITQRKQAEQALAESEQRFRAIFEQAAVGVAVLDSATGRYLSVNQRMCEINQRTPEEMLTLTFMDVTYPEDLKEDLDQMEDLKAGKISSFKMEKRNRASDGSLTWINLTVSPLWRPGEPPLRHIAVVEDISERKQAEQNYLSELAYNQALVSHTAAFIVVLDEQGRFAHGNPAFFITMGYSEKEVIGYTPWEIGLMDAKETVRSKERFARLLQGEDNPAADTRLRAKDGTWRIVELRSTTTRKADGTRDRIIVTGTDVTERHQLQQEVLKIAEQEQARLGHDLHDGVGQTMTGLVIMLEALEMEVKGKTKILAHRIHELMQESVAEVRRMSHGLSPTSVKYRGLMGALQLLAETVRTNFRTPCTADLDASITVHDPEMQTHLFRIAQEAVNNALRHGKPKHVSISLRHVSKQECELCISDDGIGIRKTKKSKTNGIGFRVMNYRANLIGAQISIEAKLQRGVTVTCRFPIAKG